MSRRSTRGSGRLKRERSTVQVDFRPLDSADYDKMIKASEENLAREEKTHSEFRHMLMKEISDLRSKKASFLLNRLKEEEDCESDSTQEMCAQPPNSPGNSEEESEEEGEIRTSKRWKDDFKKY